MPLLYLPSDDVGETELDPLGLLREDEEALWNANNILLGLLILLIIFFLSGAATTTVLAFKCHNKKKSQ